MSKLSERIKCLRTVHHITQEKLAQHCHISLRTLKYYEAGDRVPDAEVIIRFCKFFDVSADYLLGLSDSVSKNS